MKKLIFLLMTSFSLTLSTCSDNPITDDTQPGRRDYIWTADTLWTEDRFSITDIWGSSPNSIWMVAFSASAKDCLWYYDGVKMERYNQILSPGLTTVFGVSSEDIWIADAYGTIWRNRGSGWQLFKQVTITGYSWIVINSIYGKATNNLYAVGTADNYDGSGYKGIILKYDGIDWRLLNLPVIRAGFHEIKKMKNGKYLIWAENSDNGFLEKLYVFDGNNNLIEIYSDYSYPHLNEMNGEVYITIQNKIYKCVKDKLELWKEFPGNIYYGTALGRSEKDFFGSGYEGILHYNGSDLVNLYNTQMDLHGALIFEKDVVFDGYNRTSSGYNYVIIRGTLNE
ncbi:MAG: hypothetical protein ACHQLA_04540 [Ignavibacteriales bacterium]